MRFLGIDYGKSKVGLAIAEEETAIAFVHGIIPNDKNLFSKLLDLIEKEEIVKVIIGIPMYLKQS